MHLKKAAEIARPLLILAAVSFVLHLVWEKAHIGLYTGYEALEGILPVYLFATLGDVMYTLVAVGIVLIVYGSRHVWDTRDWHEYAFLAVMGLMIALFVEIKAAQYDRWEYTDAMPILWGFGLSPLLQMTVLLPLSVYITTRLERRLITGT